MLKVEKTEIYGWEAAIRGMRNPMNSWKKSDTVYGTYWGDIDGHECIDDSGFTIGKNDLSLMKRLAKAGTDHRKYLRMITVYCDITAPLYWWEIVQLLPSSYNQKRTVMLNYEVLANMYKSRKNHKLDEWHTLCYWIEMLPYSELITGEE